MVFKIWLAVKKQCRVETEEQMKDVIEKIPGSFRKMMAKEVTEKEDSQM